MTRYYDPGVPTRPLGAELPSRDEARRVVLVASFLDQERFLDQTNEAVGKLRFERRLVERFSTPQVRVWVFR